MQVAIREGENLVPKMSLEEWRQQYPAGTSTRAPAKGKAGGKGRKGGRVAAGLSPDDADVDAIIAALEATDEPASALAVEVDAALAKTEEHTAEAESETATDAPEGLAPAADEETRGPATDIEVSEAASQADDEAAALEAKRAEIMAKVAAARAAQALAVAQAVQLEQKEDAARKLRLDDLLSGKEQKTLWESNDKYENNSFDKEFRMQGEYGAKKFIKP